ncbi:unnamed protein product, partial [Allacma fusca]
MRLSRNVLQFLRKRTVNASTLCIILENVIVFRNSNYQAQIEASLTIGSKLFRGEAIFFKT